MKTKSEIVNDWLPRYTGTAVEDFGQYVILVNFQRYVDIFAKAHGVEIKGTNTAMTSCTADGITIVNFGMGSANAATIMDLLSASSPKAVLFLGKCGGLKKKNQVGDLILPIAGIRGEYDEHRVVTVRDTRGNRFEIWARLEFELFRLRRIRWRRDSVVTRRQPDRSSAPAN